MLSNQTVIYAFYKNTTSFQDAFIQTMTFSPYSHIELLVDSVVQSKSLCISASKRDGKIVREKYIEWDYDHWDFLLVKVPNRRTVIDKAYERLGERYSMIGATLSVTPLGVKIPNQCFCSEQMAYSLDYKKPYTYHPGEFFADTQNKFETRLFNGADLAET